MTESDICAFFPFLQTPHIWFILSYWHSLHKQTLLMLFDRPLPLSYIFCSFLIEKIITTLHFCDCCHNFLNYLLIFWRKLSINHHIWRKIVNHSSACLVLFHLSYAHHLSVTLQSTPCHVSITSINPSPTYHIPIHIPMSITFL